MTPDEFKNWRLNLGLSQQEAALELGFKHRSSVHHFEAGTREVSARISKLCKLVGKEIRDERNHQNMERSET